MTDHDNPALERMPVDAPELGAHVELVETTVGELLPLIKLAETGDAMALVMATLAASLWIDGKRVSEAQLRALGARKLRALMRLGPQALAINNFATATPDDGQEGAADPKH